MSEQHSGGDQKPGVASGDDGRTKELRRFGLMTRRQGLAAAAAFGAAGCAGETTGAGQTSTQEDTGETGQVSSREVTDPSGGKSERRDRAYQIRVDAAQSQWDSPDAEHPDNGDEERYPNRIASFSKTLPHGENGEVDPEAYDALLEALEGGGPFTPVPQGGTEQLDSPEAALAFVMEGPDSHNTTMRAAPAFDSAETAGEMVEVYW